MSETPYTLTLIDEETGKQINVGKWGYLPMSGASVSAKGSRWKITRVTDGPSPNTYIVFMIFDKKENINAEGIKRRIRQIESEIKTLKHTLKVLKDQLP